MKVLKKEFLNSENRKNSEIESIKKEVKQSLLNLYFAWEIESFIYFMTKFFVRMINSHDMNFDEEAEIEEIDYCLQLTKNLEEIRFFDKIVSKQVKKSLKKPYDQNETYLFRLRELVKSLEKISKCRLLSYKIETAYYFRESEFSAIIPCYENERIKEEENIKKILELNKPTYLK